MCFDDVHCRDSYIVHVHKYFDEGIRAVVGYIEIVREHRLRVGLYWCIPSIHPHFPPNKLHSYGFASPPSSEISPVLGNKLDVIVMDLIIKFEEELTLDSGSNVVRC